MTPHSKDEKREKNGLLRLRQKDIQQEKLSLNEFEREVRKMAGVHVRDFWKWQYRKVTAVVFGDRFQKELTSLHG